MVSKILKAVQTTVQKHPDAVEQAVAAVQKATNWLNRQPFGAEVKELLNKVSFTLDTGGFAELGVSKFVISKDSGSMTLYAATNSNRFPMSLSGLVKAAQNKAQAKRSDATQKAAAAKVAAEAARQAALEAARLAELAEAEADTFESAISGFAGFTSGSRY
jgi:hypothetical protein